MSNDQVRTKDTGALLVATLAAESQAVQRLLWFAETADVDGYPELAASFRAIAEEKAGHARGLLEFIDGLDGETTENLASAIALVDRKAALQELIDSASASGHNDVAEWTETLAAASARHLQRLQSGKQTLR